MKKIVKLFIFTLISIMSLLSCKQSKSSTSSRVVPHVVIRPPVGGIVGAAPSEKLPGTGNEWKGVFVKDRTVKLTPYAIAKNEVTYELWKEVYDWATSSDRGDKIYIFANTGREGSMGIDYAATTINSNHPVTMVTWRDCIVWCNAYTEKTNGNTDECVYRVSVGAPTVLKDATSTNQVDSTYADMNKKGYRLPTEAEWEYAARYKTDGNLTPLSYASGSNANWKDENATKAVTWYSGNSNNKTHGVGEKTTNGLGLYDMSGNVWEWCFDRYGVIAGDETITDPTGAISGSARIGHGGSWINDANYCVVGYRGKSDPDNKFINLGFRLAWRP